MGHPRSTEFPTNSISASPSWSSNPWASRSTASRRSRKSIWRAGARER